MTLDESVDLLALRIDELLTESLSLAAENRALRDMLTAAHSNVRALLAANDELQSALKRLCHAEPTVRRVPQVLH